MSDSREEALRLYRGAKTHTIQAPQNDDEFPDTMRFSVRELIELIRLARAQPRQEPVGVHFHADKTTFTKEDVESISALAVAAALKHASPPTQAVPEGFVLVPKHATPLMLLTLEKADGFFGPEDLWRALLSAAPKPPGGKDE